MPLPLHERCKDCIGVLQVLGFRVFYDFGKKFLRKLRNFLPKLKKTQKLKTQNLQNLPILYNYWISSAMAVAMSIYRTLCVFVLHDFTLFVKDMHQTSSISLASTLFYHFQFHPLDGITSDFSHDFLS